MCVCGYEREREREGGRVFEHLVSCGDHYCFTVSCLELRPHQPKSDSLVAECGRIRDMATVSLNNL